MSDNNRGTFAVKVERNLFDFFVVADFYVLEVENSVVHGGLEAGLEMAVEVSVKEDRFGSFTCEI